MQNKENLILIKSRNTIGLPLCHSLVRSELY